MFVEQFAILKSKGQHASISARDFTVEIIGERIGEQIGHHNRAGEVYHRPDAVPLQQTLHSLEAADVTFEEHRAWRHCPALSVQRLSTTIVS